MKHLFHVKQQRMKGETMRKKLKGLRVVELGLTQEQMAKKIEICRAAYAAVEKGVKHGTPIFWMKLQSVFGIPDEEMYIYMKVEE